MLGVYDCPLVHFGDVICLLDLIHEVNQDRRSKGLPLIASFDFYPAYNYGMPYEHKNAATYGLTWYGIPGDMAQKGLFKIVLEAYLKSSSMGVGLLFDEGKGFRTFLDRMPLPPYSVVTFLDGLFRYLDLANAKTLDSEAMNRAKYDMLVPVRAGFVKFDKEDPDHYRRPTELSFCNSCGHKMLKEFFLADPAGRRPHSLKCAGCSLRSYLDREDNHDRLKRRDQLSYLYQQFNEEVFNTDAPMNQKGRGLLNLHTRVSVHPPPPPAYMNNQGAIIQPQYRRLQVRDDKLMGDSLQNLPSLWELIGARGIYQRWFEATWKAIDDDIFRTTSRAHHDFFRERLNQRQYGAVPLGHRVIDHVDEVQPPPNVLEAKPVGFQFAQEVHKELENRIANTYRPSEENRIPNAYRPSDAAFW